MCTVIWDAQRPVHHHRLISSLLTKPEVVFHWLTAAVLCLWGTSFVTPSQPSCFPHFHWMIWKLLSRLPLTHYLEEVALDCPASPQQGSKDIPAIWPTHQFTLRGSQHTPISPPVISPLFPVLSKTTTTISISAEACHIFRVPKSFSYQPNKHRVDCFSDPRDSGDQRQIVLKWLRYGVFYILSPLIVHPCYSLVKFPAWKS